MLTIGFVMYILFGSAIVSLDLPASSAGKFAKTLPFYLSER